MPDPGPRAVLRLLRRAVAFELRLYRSLLRWVARRPAVPRSGVEAFGYARTVTPVMWVWIFASAVEIPVFHLLVPWATVRIVLVVLGAWGLVWMVGFLASLNVYPHLLGRTALRVRHGGTVDIELPWDAVAAISVRQRDLSSSMRTLQPRETERGTDLQVAVSGEVNVHAALHRPVTVPTPRGDLEVTALSFLADEPRALVTRARQLMSSTARSSTGPSEQG